MNKPKATGMTDGQMIIMKEKKEKLTGTSTKTAFSATFQVTDTPGWYLLQLEEKRYGIYLQSNQCAM